MSQSTCWILSIALLALLLSAFAMPCMAAQSIVVKNNYEMPYNGPITFRTNLPDGSYVGKGAAGTVKAGVAHITAKLDAQSQVVLSSGASKAAAGPLSVAGKGSAVSILWQGKRIGGLDFGVAVTPGRTGTTDKAVASFKPIALTLAKAADGSVSGKGQSSGYELKVSIKPYGGGWLDVNAELVKNADDKDAAYVGVVRRITTSEVESPRMRWNGRVVDGDIEPTDFVGQVGYTRCVDWCSWHSGDLSYVVANGFTAGLTTEQASGNWVPANHFYTWERTQHKGDSLYFVSEIAGPDPALSSNYKGTKSYVAPIKGEPVKLHWRMAVAKSPDPTWQESQFLVSAGYRRVSTEPGKVTVDLGVPYVEFGTSYFPYSTMCENFDYYRTPGLDREGWWPFSTTMWENWQVFKPQMQTDLRIIRAMGFDWVRMHHLELLAPMDRKNAMDFIDFFVGECRTVGLKVLIDTSGTPEWFSTLAGRYKDVVKRIEVENEILIPGIKPGDAERWSACYRAAKAAAPNTDVFLTGNSDMGIFDRLTRLGVPFDRLGYHCYKHGPGGDETMSTTAVAAAGVAADYGTTPVLGEFNWKKLTLMSPEARAKEWANIFGDLLEPRAVPELFEFHWQETNCVNQRLCRQGIRHYETIYLDRRPKPEAMELMSLIRKYARPDAPVRELMVHVMPVRFDGDKAHVEFSLTNNTAKQISVTLSPECFGDMECSAVSPDKITLNAGNTTLGTMDVTLKPDALPGVYHFFIKADYSGKTSYGWGYGSKIGDATVDSKPLLPDLVDYPQSIASNSAAWSRTDCVAFGPKASVVDVEMAYMVANTLQSATGRRIRLCSTADIPKRMLDSGNLILVGTTESNPMIAEKAELLSIPADKGAVRSLPAMDGASGSWLVLTGKTTDNVQAASTEFVLRYWKNAKDAAIRITGMEEGAALGHQVAPGQINPP